MMEKLRSKVSSLVEALKQELTHHDCAKSQVKCAETLLQKLIGQFEQSDFNEIPVRSECYGRHLLYKCPNNTFSIVMMVWGAGQGTAIHDHSGIWCVEGVAQGELEITDYDLSWKSEDSVDIKPVKTIRAGVGAVGNLIPPFEYHRISNPNSLGAAISIHVYGSEIKNCTRFVPNKDGTYRKDTVSMCYDSEL